MLQVWPSIWSRKPVGLHGLDRFIEHPLCLGTERRTIKVEVHVFERVLLPTGGGEPRR
jgi:hypothetical protein